MRTAIVDGPPSLARAGLAAGLALTALLPLGLHRAAHAQESTAARVARENLPSVATLIAVDDQDQPIALGSGFFITRDGVLVTNAHVVGSARQGLRPLARSERHHREDPELRQRIRPCDPLIETASPHTSPHFP